MPSASPSPIKRPSLNERTSSTHSLSSSSKTTNTVHKVHRPHVVTRHSRNVSHGKGLSKLNRNNSGVNVVAEGRNHQRKKSGPMTPAQSPKAGAPEPVKRNNSHHALPKNHSYGNLRKNQSATTFANNRNTSHPALKKIGLAPAPKPKNQDSKQGFFELGDQSSDENDEGEWEDSVNQSPELTRTNSRSSAIAKFGQGLGEVTSRDVSVTRPEETSSPPKATLKPNNRSAPDLRNDSGISPTQETHEPVLLQQNPRSSRAPPAMSTISARAGPSGLNRNDSSKSFTHISHAEAESMNVTPNTSGVGGSSSADAGVSHFLHTNSSRSLNRDIEDESDSDSASNFMSNYRPQPSESPEKPKRMNQIRLPHVPSRTQQKLELQRRETMRAGAATPSTPPASSIGLNIGSSNSIHSRSGSRGRNRGLAGEIKAQKQDYETAVKQLTVVRKFRNPVVDSLHRLKDYGVLPVDVGTTTPAGAASKSRPQSRRGVPSATNLNGTMRNGVSRSFEDKKSSPLASRSPSRARGSGRVHFQRQGSHDDIGITPSQTSPYGLEDDEQDGLSPEEAILRRLWESREIYDPGENGMAR